MNGSAGSVSFNLNGKSFIPNLSVFTASGPTAVSAGKANINVEDSNLTAPIDLLADTQTTAIYFGTPPFEDDMSILTER